MSNFTFTQISGNPPYSSFREASINNEGTIAFEGFVTPPSPSIPPVPTGIFTTDSSGQTTTVVDSSPSLFAGLIQPTVGTSINDQGTVAYVKTDFDQSFTPQYTGVFTSDSKTSVIDNFTSPYNFFWSPAINNEGTLAFLAGQGDPSAGLGGIFTYSNGTLTNIADSSSNGFSTFNVGFDTVGGNSPLSSYTIPSINEVGTVAFNAGLDAGGQGIFTGNSQGVTKIADSADNFDLFSSADINEQGTVAFLAQLDDKSTGIFTSSDGQLTTIADTSGDFSSFLSDPSINNQGTVAFLATLDNGVTGIFTGSDPLTDKVLAIGDELFGSTVTDLIITQSGLNDQGQLAFEVVLENGSDFVLRADPQAVPEPGESIVSVLALGILLALGLRWRQKRSLKRVGGI